MIKIDLITGFLGSGKTTFIKNYAEYLVEHGQKVGILENDFGAVNVDVMLLQDIQGDRCDIETVAGACDADCHKRRFKTKLIAMGMSGYDRVIVEPSGIFDTDEFFDTLREDPLDKWYEIGGVITVVDAALDTDLSTVSEYILASQLANAGKIIISKADLVTPEQLDKTIKYITSVSQKYFGYLPEDKIISKTRDEYTYVDFGDITECGSSNADFVKKFSQDNSYSSLYYMDNDLTPDELTDITEQILDDPKCGNVFRIKGFLKRGDDWYDFNADKSSISSSPVARGQDIIIVIGEDLNKKTIDKYFKVQ